MFEVRRHFWKSSGRDTYSQLPRMVSRQSLNISKEEIQPLWATSSSAWSPSHENVFPGVQSESRMFQLVPIASGPFTKHHWKEPGSALFASSLQVLLYIDEMPPWAFSSPGWTVPAVSAFCHRRDAPTQLIIPVVLRWTLSSMSMSLLYWGAQNWTQHSSCGLTSAE